MSATIEPGRAARPNPDLRRELAQFAGADTRIGACAFAIDVCGYAACVAGAVLAGPFWLRLLCSAGAGAFLVNLGALAHEAAHGAVVRSRRGNRLIATIAFTLLLFNYRLWIWEHHHVHHAETNEDGHNSWAPLSPDEFARLPRWRRLLERVYRSSTGLGIGPYYLIERWWREHLVPGPWVPERFHASAWRHAAGLAAYAAALVALLALAPLYSASSSAAALALGLAVPFAIWITAFSLSVLLQHTHPLVPWYRAPARGAKWPSEQLTIHVRLPYWLGWLMHFPMEHPAHHVNAAIPFHRLYAAQATLNRLAGGAVVSEAFSPARVAAVLRACKLYDFDRATWTDFNGRPTTPSHAPRSSAHRPSLEPARHPADRPRSRSVAPAA